MHTLGAGVMAGMLDELADTQLDKRARERLSRVREASKLEPEPPAELAATLRDYQREGFVWLARLAHWGAGAVLADDMGLGKTLQALALLLLRPECYNIRGNRRRR